MAEGFSRTGSFQKVARRLVSTEAEQAAEALARRSTPGASAVHEARRRLKRARAMLRLVRPGLAPRVYRRENVALAGAARPLGAVRDSVATLDTYDSVRFGFEKYAGPAIDIWYDDIAIGTERIGCN